MRNCRSRRGFEERYGELGRESWIHETNCHSLGFVITIYVALISQSSLPLLMYLLLFGDDSDAKEPHQFLSIRAALPSYWRGLFSFCLSRDLSWIDTL